MIGVGRQRQSRRQSQLRLEPMSVWLLLTTHFDGMTNKIGAAINIAQ